MKKFPFEVKSFRVAFFTLAVVMVMSLLLAQADGPVCTVACFSFGVTGILLCVMLGVVVAWAFENGK